MEDSYSAKRRITADSARNFQNLCFFAHRTAGEFAFRVGSKLITLDGLPANMKRLNFGRNITLNPRVLHAPRCEQEVIEILDANKGSRIRCIGRLHSWSEAVQCDDVLLDLRYLSHVELSASGDTAVARAGGGCQIKQLLAELEKQNWTLPSVGFITEQSVAGAISTGTHGSGRHSLSHYVTSLRVARYDRDSGKAVIEEIECGDELRAARCSLGCVGVILSVAIRCRPMYRVEEHFREHDNLDSVLSAEKDYPLQQFYLVPWCWTFIAQHRREVEAPNSRTSCVYHWYRFIALDVAMHLLILLSVRVIRIHAFIRTLFRWVLPTFVVQNCRFVADSTTQLVMEHGLFRHVEIELFVQRDRLDAALKFLQHALCTAGDRVSDPDEAFLDQVDQANCTEALDQLRGKYCHHYPICVRKVLPDDTLISMASNANASPVSEPANATDRPPNYAWYSITLTNYHRGANREPFENLAEFLARSMRRLFRARPHWGKLCPLSSDDLHALYPAMGRFREVCAERDPDGRFNNLWTESVIHHKDQLKYEKHKSSNRLCVRSSLRSDRNQRPPDLTSSSA
ncbi:FAD-binding protein [Rhodopirellula sp. JC639]|uniref:FAD-binding protein n=1 Tax=Stieleria mannarensis TaxID=2755585 RepID=UPI0016049735|nr:FAD-binding protein [Rhodopirellula sp. JC639]